MDKKWAFYAPLTLTLESCVRQVIRYLHLTHWGGTTKVTRVTIVTFNCKQEHMEILSCSVLGDRERIQQSALVRININTHTLM